MPKPNDLTNLQFDEIVASEMTFEQIAAKYGEDTAINVGIARDPDTFECDDEWFDNAKPSSEAVPHILERYPRTRGTQKAPTKEPIYIRLDADIVAQFRDSGPGWQTRLNDTLRQAVFGN